MADCLIVAISQLISALHPGGRLVSQTLYVNAYYAAEPGSNTIQREHLEDLPSLGWSDLASSQETFDSSINNGFYFPLSAILQAL